MNLSSARLFAYSGLALFLAGAAVIAWTLRTHAGADLPIPAELTVAGAFVAGGSGLLVAWVGWRTLRLGSEAQAIARWIVLDAEWQRYTAACRMRETMPGALPGTVPLDLPVPPQGIEVMALRRGFRVGESFHEIGGLSAEVLDVRVVDSPAPMFEFNVVYATGRTSSVRRAVRIPTAGADALANQVEDYWIAREPLLVMTADQLRRRERAGWTLALLGFVAFLGVIALFVVVNPPGWAAIGPIGTLGLAGYGFLRAFRARTVRWRKERNS